MKLRKKLLTILFTISSLIIGIIIYFSFSIILESFEKIQKDHTNNSIGRFQEIIEGEFNKLLETTIGWSSWDDTYNFVLAKPQTQNYIKNNFEIGTILDSNFSRVMLFNIEKKILFSRDYFQKTKEIKSTPETVVNDFSKNILTNLSSQKLAKAQQGIFYNQTTQEAEIYSVNPVLPGSGIGPHQGYMVFTRVINQEMLARFKRIMKVPVHLTLLPNTLINQSVSVINEESKTATHVKVNYLDIPRNFIINFSFDISKKFFLLGQDTIKLFLILILVSMGILCFAFYVIFNKLIINRILILNDELNTIAKTTQFKNKVSEIGTDEIGTLSRQVNKTLETLEENQMILNRSSKLSALGEVAASIAHEINNPITVISLQAASINKNLDKNILEKDDLKNRVDKIKKNVSRIEKIVKSLRFISRDGERDEFEFVKLEVIVDEIDSLFNETLKHKGIKLSFSELDTAIELKCKPVQIAQVFINLISNAIDALESRQEKWINISSVIENDKICIKVTDSGECINAEIAEKIMEPFFTTKPSGKGTGLGLSITKKIIEAHGGTFTLKTQPHTEFKICFKKDSHSRV